MLTKSIIERILTYQKLLLDASFAWMDTLQEQGCDIMAMACEKNRLFPGNNEKVCAYWIDFIRESRTNYQEYMDSNFQHIRDFYSANPQIPH